MKKIDIQKQLLDIFDYSYANSPIKVPTIACREVGKILHVAMYLEEKQNIIPGFQYSQNEIKEMQGNGSMLSQEIALSVRKHFKEMNDSWELYDKEILFTDINISYIVGRLNGIYISDPTKDVFGDALELFRSQWAKQEGGQFFTDQRVTSLAINMIDFDPTKGDRLVDLCSGTGGFLLAGLNKIKKIADLAKEDEKFITTNAKASLNGFEIDSSVAELGNATLSGRVGSSKSQFIQKANSLDKKLIDKKYSKAVTNPPFGSKISVKDEEVLSQYQLARISNANCDELSISKSKLFKRAPDILFIERNVDILEEGGLLAIVLPYQILSGPQTYYVRNWLLKNTRLRAIIDLPPETFQPHTGTKTCLLVIEKLNKPLLNLEVIDDHTVFMASPKWIGHDRRGNTVYKKSVDGSETEEVLTDFPQLEQAYNRYAATGELDVDYPEAFTVNIKSILDDELLRINAAFHNPKHVKNVSNVNEKNFELVPLSSLVERVFFPGRFKRNYVNRYDRAVPFLGGTNITQMISHTDKWFRHDDPKLEKLAVKEGWILVTRSGTTGIVSSVPSYWDGFAVSEHVIRIVPNDKIDPEFILAFLKTPQCQAALSQRVFGSVIDEITPETIEKIQVPIPKDKALYSKIVAKVKEAEKARSTALDELFGAIDDLTESLSN